MANDRVNRIVAESGATVFSSKEGARVPGLDWKIQAETEQAIKEIESNLKVAEQKSGHLLLG